MTIAITGATAGIGREVARQLVAKGAQVAIGGRRQERLDELARGSAALALGTPCDGADTDQCKNGVVSCSATYGT